MAELQRYVLAILLGAAAIAGNLATLRSSPAKDPTDVVLDQLDRFTNTMCECNDEKCAQQVSDQITRWAMQLPDSQRNAKPDQAHMLRAQQIAQRLGTCMTHVMDRDAPAAIAAP